MTLLTRISGQCLILPKKALVVVVVVVVVFFRRRAMKFSIPQIINSIQEFLITL